MTKDILEGKSNSSFFIFHSSFLSYHITDPPSMFSDWPVM